MMAGNSAGELQPILQVRRLSHVYPNGHQALYDVTFSLAAGETVGLLGPNGAGKTTLMLHLNGLLPGTDGRESGAGAEAAGQAAVVVGGLPVSRRHLAEVRRQVGFLFQDPDDQLFCPTVREDVAFGPLNLGLSRAAVLQRVTDSLAAVGLADLADRSTQHLSFGERKRVCLAGVLACEPALLVLDEPSSNLDPRARRGFMTILRSCAAAQLIASHDLELILELCSRVLILDHGRIQADGPTREILSNAPLLERHGLEVPLSLMPPSRSAS